jgi:RimJ/RimL family protein N-acetyltransferase
VIKGEHIALTALMTGDKELLFRWINSPETVRFNAPYAPVHESRHSDWFEAIANDRSRVVFAIRGLEDHRLIGLVQLIDLHPVHRTAELTIRIGDENDRNRGAGSEAVRLAIDTAIRDHNIQRVWLRVFADNERAIRAYQKAGMTKEGILHRASYIDGRWRDVIVMACLAPLENATPDE